jgi:hypothetical protein
VRCRETTSLPTVSVFCNGGMQGESIAVCCSAPLVSEPIQAVVDLTKGYVVWKRVMKANCRNAEHKNK